MNPADQPEPKQNDSPKEAVLLPAQHSSISSTGSSIPDGQGEVSLREEEIEHILASAFQDGFGAAHDPKYRNRTVEHTKRIMALHEADKAVAVRAERERVFEGTSKAIHDTYFSVLNGIANGLAASLPDTANKIRMIADKARKDMLDDLIAEAAQSRLQPPTAGEGEREEV